MPFKPIIIDFLVVRPVRLDLISDHLDQISHNYPLYLKKSIKRIFTLLVRFSSTSENGYWDVTKIHCRFLCHFFLVAAVGPSKIMWYHKLYLMNWAGGLFLFF